MRLTLIASTIILVFQSCLFSSSAEKEMSGKLRYATGPFEIIFKQDFENTRLGYYSLRSWANDWNNPPWGDGVLTGDRAEIIDYEKGGRTSRGMKWIFPEGTFSTNRQHGYQWRPPLDDDYEECYLSYSILFKPGFEPVLGGKLPCLMGYPISDKPDPEDGFYAGIMFKEGPRPVFYVYHHDMTGEYGETRFWDFVFDVSREIWYDITLRVVMNSVSGETGNQDGLVEGYINGELVGQWDGIRFRNRPEIGIDVAVIQAFFGGDDPSWATRRDEWMLIDNVVVWKYSEEYISGHPGIGSGNQKNPLGSQIITPLEYIHGSPSGGNTELPWVFR